MTEIAAIHSTSALASAFGCASKLWLRLQAEANAAVSNEHLLAPFIGRLLLDHESFSHAVAALVSKTLEPYDGGAVPLRHAILDLM
jgi:hypothetical protein